MHRTTTRIPPTITADGKGVVSLSRAGTVLLSELADRIGMTAALSEATGGLLPEREDQRRLDLNCR